MMTKEEGAGHDKKKISVLREMVEGISLISGLSLVLNKEGL